MKKLFCILTVACLLFALVAAGTLTVAATKEQDEQILVGAEPTATATETEAEPTATAMDVTPVLRGDITADGAVNMKDVLILKAFLCGHVNFNKTENVWLYGDLLSPKKIVSVNVPNADANGDGSVNMKDVVLIRKYLAGIVETL